MAETTPTRAKSPSATQRMFFELAETSPVDLPPHLRYKSPNRAKKLQGEFQGTPGRYMEPKKPVPEAPANLGHPDYENIHGNQYGAYANTSSRVWEEKDKPAPAQNFTPLDKTEGLRYTPELEKIKDFAARSGFGDVPSKYVEDTQAKIQFEEGRTPRDLAEQHRREKLGIHPRTFRPVADVCAKTFDEYASLAKVWKKTHGVEDEDKEIKKMNRPSVVMEYVRNSTPILSRKGVSITPTGKEKARVEEIRRRPQQEFHFKPSPFGADFTTGPGSERPKGFKRGVKECYNRERDMIRNLAERLSGHSARYSPSRIESLSTPLPHHRWDADMQQQQHYSTSTTPRQQSPAPGSGVTPQDRSGVSVGRGGGGAHSVSMGGGEESTSRRLDAWPPDKYIPEEELQRRRGGQRNKTPLRAQTPQGPQRPRQWR